MASETNPGRVTGQTKDVGFQIGVRRTLPVPPGEAWARLTSPEWVRTWLGGDPGVELAKGAEYSLADGSRGEIRVCKPGSHLRLTWWPEGWPRASTVQVRVLPATGERTVFSFHQEHLPGPAEREERRAFYAGVLDALEAMIRR